MTNIFNIFSNPHSRIHFHESDIQVTGYAVDGEIELSATITDARIATLHDEMNGVHVNALPSRLSVVASALEQVIQIVGTVAATVLVGGSLATPAIQGCLGSTGVSLFLEVIATAVQAIWMIMLAVTNFRYGQVAYQSRQFDPLREALIGTQKLFYPLIAIFEGLELLAGFGEPENGENFSDGDREFSIEIFDILQNAFPAPDQWSSDAAKYYADKNLDQQYQVQEFADADRHIAGTLNKQAHQIDQARQGMAGGKLGFLGAMTIFEPLLEQAAVACEAASTWRAGDPLSMEIQHQIAVSKTKLYMDLVGVAAFSAIIAFLGLIIALIAEADKNHREAKRAILAYQSVISETQSIILSTRALAEAPALASSPAFDVRKFFTGSTTASY